MTASAAIDASTLYGQIPLRVRMLLGITRSKVIYSERQVTLPINDSHTLKVIVRLSGEDLYDLECGHVKGLDWVTDGTVSGVHCEQLGEALVRLVEDCAAVWGDIDEDAL